MNLNNTVELDESESIVNSKILSANEINALRSWIGETKQTRLLYRASRDGHSALEFHSKCDNKAKTVTLIRTHTDNVIGGYTAARWTSSLSYSYDTTSYIFSLRISGVSGLQNNAKKFGLRSAALSYSNYAIYNDPLFGPSFGNGDIRIVGNSLKNFGGEAIYSTFSTYNTGPSNVFGTVFTDWTTLEIEVFQIL